MDKARHADARNYARSIYNNRLFQSHHGAAGIGVDLVDHVHAQDRAAVLERLPRLVQDVLVLEAHHRERAVWVVALHVPHTRCPAAAGRLSAASGCYGTR